MSHCLKILAHDDVSVVCFSHNKTKAKLLKETYNTIVQILLASTSKLNVRIKTWLKQATSVNNAKNENKIHQQMLDKAFLFAITAWNGFKSFEKRYPLLNCLTIPWDNQAATLRHSLKLSGHYLDILLTQCTAHTAPLVTQS